jgi:hypothetical protein
MLTKTEQQSNYFPMIFLMLARRWMSECRAWGPRCEAGFPTKFDTDFEVRQPVLQPANRTVSRLC